MSELGRSRAHDLRKSGLGRAAVQAMLAVSAASPVGAVLESNFYRSHAAVELGRLPGAILELFCRCDGDVAVRRYRDRAGTRHAGHFDHVRSAEELWNAEVGEPVAGGWPVIEVDTNAPVDIAGLASRVRKALGDREPALSDGVVSLRPWRDSDAAWYADMVGDPQIQRFTTEPPTLDEAQVLAAIEELRRSSTAAGFLICDAVSGAPLGNIALQNDDGVGEVSYWVRANVRGRGIATRALRIFAPWAAATSSLREIRLCTHRDNTASQRAAMRAGFIRDPDHDHEREVKGTTWPMHAYVLAATEQRCSSVPQLPVTGPNQSSR
jgi:ribosomal-protein-alanine N-acetyltransferase